MAKMHDLAAVHVGDAAHERLQLFDLVLEVEERELRVGLQVPRIDGCRDRDGRRSCPTEELP